MQRTLELTPVTRYTAAEVRHATRSVNERLHQLGRTYHPSVPLDEVSHWLRAFGFNELEPMLLCGREGRLHEFVGNNRWLALTWYKMESGRYEVVAYVS
jgi:hypothetical protein